MKKLLYPICCILSLTVYAQQSQKVNTFHVVDAKTKSAVPYASVVILRAKLAIATEDNGVFHIPGNLATMRDTIAFYAQNYAVLKLPLNRLATIDTIRLTGITFTRQNASGKYTEKMILNDHIADDVGLYAGVASEGAPFNYMQIAQLINTSKPNGKLVNVIIKKSTDWIYTKFRIRIYGIDPVTGSPDADLCDRVIDLDNQKDVDAHLNQRGDWDYVLKSAAINLDLNKYNIIIPNKSFFVAIEWLRTFDNGVKAPVYNKLTNKTDTAIVFRPYIGISPVTGPKLNIWVMELDHKWKTYDHFYPFGTDLAIKATVEY